MADIAIFRINYKSDFILTLQSDAGWMTPFCIKFWTGAPSQAYFAGYDGTTYTHCAPVDGDPTKLSVQFDDHHLPIGDMKFQIGYHFTVADFPTSIEDEVINQAAVIIDNDGEQQQVMLDFNGETAPEIAFAMPAYANEAQRIANEQARIAAEEQRVSNEQQRISNEEGRISAEESRQENEQQRIHNEETRIAEFASLKAEAIEATGAANDAATFANEKAQLAADKAALAQTAATLANDKAQLAADKASLAQAAATLANDKAALAQQKADYAQAKAEYAQAQGDYAKAQSDIALADHERAETDHERAEADHDTATDDHTTATSDHTQAESDHTRAEADHTTAASDHTQASSDHSTATTDHTQAGQDHTRAESDHTTAAADHTRAESDHAAVEAYVDSLGAFDISAYHATGSVLAKYADLTAALGTNGANIPDELRKGGMSVKFVLSSDNNSTQYVQYRYMSTSTAVDEFTNVANWQGVDSTNLSIGNNDLATLKGVFSLIKSDDVSKWCVEVNYSIETNGKFGTNTSYKHIYKKVNSGESYLISATDNYGLRIAFATSYAASSNGTVPMVAGTNVVSINKGEIIRVTIPEGCTYLLVYNIANSRPFNVRTIKNIDEEPIANSKNFIDSNGTYLATHVLEDVSDIVGNWEYTAKNTFTSGTGKNNGTFTVVTGGEQSTSDRPAINVARLINGERYRLTLRLTLTSAVERYNNVAYTTTKSASWSYLVDTNNNQVRGNNGELLDIVFVADTTKKYISISLSGLNQGDTLVVDSFGIKRVVDFENYFETKEDAEEISTSVQEIAAKTTEVQYFIGQSLVKTGYYRLYSYKINSTTGVVQSDEKYSSVYYKKVNKGDKIRFYGASDGTSRAVVIGFFESKPVLGGTATKVISKTTGATTTPMEVIVEAENDGWIGIYYYDLNWSFVDIDDVITGKQQEQDNYVIEETINAPLVVGKYIDLDENSNTYGSVLDSGVQTYGVSDFIDISGVSYLGIRCITSNAAATRNSQTYGSMFYAADHSPLQPVLNARAVYTAYPQNGAATALIIAVPDSAKYFRYFDYYTYNNVIEPYYGKVNRSIVTKDDEYIRMFRQAIWTNGNGKTLNLLHFSDIHGDTKAAELFKAFASKIAYFVSDILCTGDFCYQFFNSTNTNETSVGDSATYGYKWWTEITELASKCLLTIGNHDGATKETTEYDQKEDSAAWDGKGKEWDYDTYFAPYASQLGITQPTGVDDISSPNYKACYWHKDYSAQKIRLIGLDCMHRYDGLIDDNDNPIADSWVKHATMEQENWLKDKLAETLDSNNSAYNYSVVFACHYPLDDFSGDNEEWNDTTHKFDYNHKVSGGRVMNHLNGDPTRFHELSVSSYTATKKFNMRNRVSEPSATIPYTKGAYNHIADIIQDWVDNGGKYVAWICGHTHVDYMWYPTQYPNLLTVVIDKAGASTASGLNDRTYNDTRLCANYYTIDTTKGWFKIIRIGLTFNNRFDKKTVLCYDYVNKKVLNEG